MRFPAVIAATGARAARAATTVATAAVGQIPRQPLQFSFTEPIHILGAGAMGMLWAASVGCVFPSYPVKLLLRDTAKNAEKKSMAICLRRAFDDADVKQQQHHHHHQQQQQPMKTVQPVTVTKQGKSSKRISPRIVHVPCETVSAMSSNSIRNLIVTTKATQAVEAVESVHHRINEATRIILLCNGALAVAEDLKEMLRGSNLASSTQQPIILLALTTHGAYREDSSDADADDDDDDELHHVVHAGYGNTVLQGCEELAVLFDMCGLHCSNIATAVSSSDDDGDDEMQRLLWNKLAANCVINPLTALHRCLNGEIRQLFDFSGRYYPQILREVARVRVAVVTNATTGTTGGAGGGVSQAAVETEMRDYVDAVIRDTANNRSSMLQDVAAGRLTEVDYLSGYVVRTGRALGIATPVNEELWRAVQSLQQQNKT